MSEKGERVRALLFLRGDTNDKVRHVRLFALGFVRRLETGVRVRVLGAVLRARRQLFWWAGGKRTKKDDPSSLSKPCAPP